MPSWGFGIRFMVKKLRHKQMVDGVHEKERTKEKKTIKKTV